MIPPATAPPTAPIPAPFSLVVSGPPAQPTPINAATVIAAKPLTIFAFIVFSFFFLLQN
jgi:hypothetical protein